MWSERMANFCRTLSLLLLFSFLAADAAKRSRYQLKWHHFDCQSHWSVFHNITCRIVPEDVDKLNSDMWLNEPIHNIWCRYKLLVPRPTQTTDMVMFEAVFDACQLLREGFLKNKLALTIYQSMVKVSNVPKHCPLKEGPLYFHDINGLDGMPALLPEMDFTLILIFYQPNTTHSLDITLRGTVMEAHRGRPKKLLFNKNYI